MRDARASELIRTLDLAAHPEGGHYKEIFRARETVTPRDGRGERAALSVIFFLLCAGEMSRWHSLRADEQWTLLEGGPLELTVLDPVTFQVAPCRLDRGAATTVVPCGAWQAARPLGSFALVTCTVGPGFDFADFRFMADDAKAAARLRREAPLLAKCL